MKNMSLVIMLLFLLLVVFASVLIMHNYNPYKKLQQIHEKEREEEMILQGMLGEAYVLFTRNDLNGAEKRLHLLLRSAPNNFNALQMLGNVYFKQEKYHEAEQIFLTLISLDETNAISHNNLGQALFQQQKYLESLIHFKKSAELAPDNHQPRLNMAEVYIKLNRKKDAIEELRKVFEIEKKENSIIINLNAFNALKDEKEFQELIRINRESTVQK